MRFDIKADPLSLDDLGLDIDAKALARAGADGLAEHLKGTIVASADPVTGAPKKALSPRVAARSGRKGGRGYDTGELARGLKVRGRGSTLKASAKVETPSGRHAFIAQEAKRGVRYMSGDGLAAEAIDRAVSEELEEQTK